MIIVIFVLYWRYFDIFSLKNALKESLHAHSFFTIPKSSIFEGVTNILLLFFNTIKELSLVLASLV